MAEVLKFACELSSKAARILFDYLHDVGEKEGLTNYQFTKTPSEDDLSDEQQEFILLCVDCLFLCPASDRTAVYSAFLSCVNHVVILTKENMSTAAVEHFFKSVSSFPNYLFFLERWSSQLFRDDVLPIMLDLNAVVLTSSGESKDVQKYFLAGNSFLKKSGGRNFVYLIDIPNVFFHSELFPELISAPVCSSQPPVDDLLNNENNNIEVPLTENHCLSLVRRIDIHVKTVEDAALLKNVLSLVTAPRKIIIIIASRKRIREEEEKAFKDQLIESAINGINFTDNLHSLKLFHINIAAKYKAFISDSLQHSPNLRELNLSFIPLRRGVSHLAENLHHVPQLTELVLANVQMGEKECAALAASLKYLNKLQELDIHNNALGHGIIELAKSLNNVPNLTKLDLSNTNMGKDDASALAASLKYLNKLKELNIRNNALGHGIIELAKNLNNVPNLTNLVLTNTNMGEDEASALAASLKYLKNLEELNIHNNALGHGIIELAKNLNNVPNLTDLDLASTKMGEDEASALAHALKYVPVLQFLDLDSNPLGRGVRDLVQHLRSVPKLEILYLKGVQMTRTEFEELCTAVDERNIEVNTDYHEQSVMN